MTATGRLITSHPCDCGPDPLTGERAAARDFWGRQVHVLRHCRDLEIVGRVVTVATDDRQVLEAVDHARGAYSVARRTGARFRIELHSSPDPPLENGPLPDDLFDRIAYVGSGDWLALDLGPFGHLQVDLGTGFARGVLAPALARRPDEVARCLLHTATTNFLLRDGVGMIHAAALVRRVGSAIDLLLLAGDDGVGKSTAALNLVGEGWSLLCESSVYIEDHDGRLRFSGFPVGVLRLRADVVDQADGWPVSEERVRGETKYRVNLAAESGAVWTDAVVPDRVMVVLLERGSSRGDPTAAVTDAETAEALSSSSIYWDREAVWSRNEEMIERLTRAADAVRVRLEPDRGLTMAALADLDL